MTKKILNLAHRGFSGCYPENSKIAFEEAMKIDGCDGIETDVHFTKDGQLVIIHDPVLERTTNGHGFVRDYTYEELLELDNGSWMDTKFAGQRLMLWSEVLDMCKQMGKVCNLEIKNYEVFYEGIEQEIIKVIEAQKMQDKVFLSSFNHISMEACKRINPDIETGLLYDKPLAEVEFYMSRMISDAIHPRYTLLQYQPNLTKFYQSLGKKVNTWTVNEETDMQDMIAQGVDSIITNYPDCLSVKLQN